MMVDSTLLMASSVIAGLKANQMDVAMVKVKQFLDYCAMHEDVVITYSASDMLLIVHSDVGCLNKKSCN